MCVCVCVYVFCVCLWGGGKLKVEGRKEGGTNNIGKKEKGRRKEFES